MYPAYQLSNVSMSWLRFCRPDLCTSIAVSQGYLDPAFLSDELAGAPEVGWRASFPIYSFFLGTTMLLLLLLVVVFSESCGTGATRISCTSPDLLNFSFFPSPCLFLFGLLACGWDEAASCWLTAVKSSCISAQR